MKCIYLVLAMFIAISGCSTSTEVPELKMADKSRGEICLAGEPADAFKPAFKQQARALALQACNKEKFTAFRFSDAERQVVMNGKSHMCGTFYCEK